MTSLLMILGQCNQTIYINGFLMAYSAPSLNLKPICDIIGFVDQRHPVKVGGMILSDLGRAIMIYTQILNQLVTSGNPQLVPPRRS